MKKITCILLFIFVSSSFFGMTHAKRAMEFSNDPALTFIPAEDQGGNPFSIYPNPVTKGFVFITSESAEPKEIHIFDVLGKEIIRTSLKGNRLDVSVLESGIYILKVVQGKSSITKKLIVK